MAICGGEGATVNAEDGPRGLDFGLDYCYSGEHIGGWITVSPELTASSR